jgi:hypothetical protein
LDLDRQLSRIRDDFCAISTITSNDPSCASSLQLLMGTFAKSLKDELVREVNTMRDEVARGEVLPQNFDSLIEYPNVIYKTVEHLMELNELEHYPELLPPAMNTDKLKKHIAKQVDEIVTISQMRRQKVTESAFPPADEDILASFDMGDCLGAGSFGVTNNSRYQRDGRVYALKQVDMNRARQHGFDDKIVEREAETLRALKHPTLCTVITASSMQVDYDILL